MDDRIETTKKGEDIEVSNGESTLPTYRPGDDVVATEQIQKPKQSYFTRAVHSFKRREDNIRLNNLGQQIVDPEKETVDSVTVSHDTSRLNRKLKGRHMQMIAIGGAIGTGLFIGSGSALATGGPLGLLIGFGLIGIMLFCVIHALGELAVMFPISGTFHFLPLC